MQSTTEISWKGLNFMKELNIMEATVLTSPSIRLWWASPLANSPTPASVCVRPAKSSSLFPVRVWQAQ